jgi:hypothetical protein
MNVEGETESSTTSATEGVTTPTETTSETTTSLIEGETETETTTEEYVPLTAEDITFSDTFEVQEEFRDEFLSIVNDQEKSPKDRTQALVGLYEKAALAASEASSNAWANTQKEWQDAVKADPEIGGDKLPTTLSAVNKLVTEYGSDKLVEVFALTGAGNNPEMIKFLNKVAGVLTEGKPISGGAPTNQGTDAASRLFPSMNKG